MSFVDLVNNIEIAIGAIAKSPDRVTEEERAFVADAYKMVNGTETMVWDREKQAQLLKILEKLESNG